MMGTASEITRRDLYRPAANRIVFVATTGEEVGWLSWDNGKLEFAGNFDESAKLFVTYLLRAHIDQLLSELKAIIDDAEAKIRTL